ncbi:MAG: toll/interleukin-1 receptor domain-containing protein [Acidimicrobiales bacterium]
MGGIFLSYRRSDSAYAAGRLRDDLAERFGADALVFRDIESMPLGRYPDAITSAIRACDALLVLIGAGWLAAADAAGNRRLDLADDWVRQEIAAGLAEGKVVVPVLLEGTRLPPASDLPDDIAALALHQAVELPDSRWDYEVGRLVEQLGAVLRVPTDARMYTGPWMSPDAPVRVTVDKVEARPGSVRFHLAVVNATQDELELSPDWFDVTDDAGHHYGPIPPWEEWPGRVAPGGTCRGVITVGEGLQPAARVLTAGWVRALGTFEVGAVHATIELR